MSLICDIRDQKGVESKQRCAELEDSVSKDARIEE